MKNIPLILSTGLLLLASCSTNKEQTTTAGLKTDNLTLQSTAKSKLTTRLRMKPVINGGEPLELYFTVYNGSSDKQNFCKWHTPFEPPMSKYLDISDPQGNEALYQGIMAKRVMPPPTDSYIEIKPGDSLSTKVDLRKAYLLDKPGTYTVRYTAQEISGLTVTDSIRFIYHK